MSSQGNDVRRAWPVPAAASLLLLGPAIAHFGVARHVFGDDPTALQLGCLAAPFVVVSAILLVWEGARRLTHLRERWQAGSTVDGFDVGRPAREGPPTPAESHRVTSRPGPPPASRVAHRSGPVRLGNNANPAYTRWRLRWSVGGATGTVPLPLGERVLLGSGVDCHVCFVDGGVSSSAVVVEVTRGGVRLRRSDGSLSWSGAEPGGGVWPEGSAAQLGNVSITLEKIG